MIPPAKSTDTIGAIATAPGAGAIGIIRISGSRALAILQTLFHPHRPHSRLTSHRLYYGHIKTPQGRLLDEVLAVYMRAPATYTREDIVEIHSHGSYLVLQSILEEVFRSGARPAEPGEFTKRAFLAGRIDLTRAEAVIDLLQARTRKSIQLAAGQLEGRLHDRIEKIRQSLIRLLALMEVAIDFPEDDIEIMDSEDLAGRLEKEVQRPLVRLINQARQGKIIREGVRVVITGAPNVGKSSLLNALLNEERALVTAIPGTTRDTIEETIVIRGIPVRIIDTAGIRTHADQIEELGIERTRKKMAEADLILFMVDASQALAAQEQERTASLDRKPRIIVLNKMDQVEQKQLDELKKHFSGNKVVCTAALLEQGLDDLRAAVYDHIVGNGDMREPISLAPNRRHLLILEQVLDACLRVRQALSKGGITIDLLTVDIQDALDHLGEIVGLTTPEDVLDMIFREFCLGK